MKVFVLAGGFATRLWPLTESRAKPLLKVAGKPLLSSAVEAVPEDLPVTVSTNAAFEKDFRAWEREFGRKNLRVSIEDAGHEGEKLGALGAVAKWVRDEKVDDDIFLIAGDNYGNCDMKAFLSLFRGRPLIAGFDVASHDLARRFGTIITGSAEGTLRPVTSFEEKPLHPSSTVVSTGWWVLPKSELPTLLSYADKHPDNVGGIFEEFLRKNTRVDCFVFTGLWKDIGSFEAYLGLHRELVGEKTLSHASATIDPETVLEGSVDIGPKTTVKKSRLRDCILFGDSVIDDCVLSNCIIDEGCVLRGVDLQNQMLRAGTVLEA